MSIVVGKGVKFEGEKKTKRNEMDADTPFFFFAERGARLEVVVVIVVVVVVYLLFF